MKNESSQPLIDYVRSLGFEKPEDLSKWVHGILKGKEDFAKRFIVEEKSETAGRPEKALINSQAKILVDNLCLLKPYMNLFGKSPKGADSKHFEMFRQLKNGLFKPQFEPKYLELRKALKADKVVVDHAFEILPVVAEVLLANSRIDITTKSLRGLINSEAESNDALDFSRTIDIAAWNELSDLKEKLLDGNEDDSMLYCQIGEKLIELEELGDALIALIKSVELDESNGIAWALQAKVYLELLSKSREEQMSALAHTDFSGFIDHPIDAEERWINERIEDIYNSSESLRRKFIEAAVKGLLNWPCWEYTGFGKKSRNFRPSLKNAEGCQIDLDRDWLIAYLVISLQSNDFDEQLHQDFLTILCDLQGQGQDIHPLPSLGGLYFYFQPRLCLQFKIDFVDILCQFYPERAKLALAALIRDMREWGHNSDEHLAILNGSKIKQIIWDFLGKEEFKKLYATCEKNRFEKHEKERISTVCELELGCVFQSFSKLSSMLKHNSELEFRRHVFQEAMIDVNNGKEPYTADEIFDEFNRSSDVVKQCVETGKNLTEEPLWQRDPFALNLPNGMKPLIFLGAILQLSVADCIDSLGIIFDFALRQETFKSVISQISEKWRYDSAAPLLIKFFLSLVKGRRDGVLLSQKLEPLGELVFQQHQFVCWEMSDELTNELDYKDIDGLTELLSEKDSLTLKP